ncbi:hypothetical protein [Rhizobium mongolense]|uniref:hypothetical protein n=1 Tax=Rhizobium mongolense TaxID=57676 RepID=UPI0011140DB9|nr:hypothetical protein [Rhizobium mongolense]
MILIYRPLELLDPHRAAESFSERWGRMFATDCEPNSGRHRHTATAAVYRNTMKFAPLVNHRGDRVDMAFIEGK